MLESLRIANGELQLSYWILFPQVALEVAVGHEKDCKTLAGQLEAWEGLPHSRWLADGIRQRTEDWESLCQSLLQQGMVS